MRKKKPITNKEHPAHLPAHRQQKTMHTQAHAICIIYIKESGRGHQSQEPPNVKLLYNSSQY